MIAAPPSVKQKFVVLGEDAFARLWANARNVVQGLESVACDCGTCKHLCHLSPCIGTPEDIEAITLAGHVAKLARSTHVAFLPFGVPPVDIVAPRMTEAGCAFLDKLGHCTLHAAGLKPTEGRLSGCTRTVEESASIPMAVLQTWL